MKTSAIVGDCANLAGDVLGDVVVGLEIRADDLHVDRRRRAHADDGIDQAAGGEERRQLRHLLGIRFLIRRMYS